MTPTLRTLAGLVAVALLATGGVAAAQCDGNGTNIALTINGIVPSTADAATHVVPVGTTWTLDITGAPAPFILLGGTAVSCGAIAVPWGSIDLAGAFVLLDGINPQTQLDLMATTDFSVTLATAPLGGACTPGALTPAIQAIGLDFTAPPFFLDNTEAGQARNGETLTVYAALGDDVTQTHVLSCGTNITFGGITYTQFFFSSNGAITFTSGQTDFSPTHAEFQNGFRAASLTGANPGVAAMQGDYSRGVINSDSVAVRENFALNTVTVEYRHQYHWNSNWFAGDWSVQFGAPGSPDEVTIDITGFVAGTTADQPKMMGVTDGTNAAGGVDTVIDYATQLPFISAGTGPNTIGQLFTNTQQPTVGRVQFLHFPGLGAYNWFVQEL